ncbi:rCG30310 [Rattus norvegicus]|uniref:RCG30310 n=1 Tax=Rattus norvegicus TaxID=10116 RepID=A6IMF6_RAT|nr:rCG30310 [Rattus norvegicus]
MAASRGMVQEEPRDLHLHLKATK